MTSGCPTVNVSMSIRVNGVGENDATIAAVVKQQYCVHLVVCVPEVVRRQELSRFSSFALVSFRGIQSKNSAMRYSNYFASIQNYLIQMRFEQPFHYSQAPS